jgi:maleate isomerase
MMNERIGWRGKIGLILPSVQTVTEPLYYRIAPEGIAFFTSRILVRHSVMADHGQMEQEAFRAGRELATAGVDCIAYCCTVSGVLKGIEGDREFCHQLQQETGIPTTSTLSAILESLELLSMKKLFIVSPYQEEAHLAEEKFFQTSGFTVVKSRSMGIDTGIKFAQVTPYEIYRFSRENWDEGADGLFISCMNFNAMPCIGSLEVDLGKPVMSSHSATLWKVLKMVGVREAIPGFGRLLSEKL